MAYYKNFSPQFRYIVGPKCSNSNSLLLSPCIATPVAQINVDIWLPIALIRDPN